MDDDRLYEIALAEIERNIGCSGLNGRTLAQRLGRSQRLVAAVFRQRSRETVAETVRRIRVERAMAMISASTMSLKEIACACGFFDQSHMTHTLKKTTGRTPSQLRHRIATSASAGAF